MTQPTPATDLLAPEQSPPLYRYSAAALCVLIGLSTLPWMWMSFGRFGGFAWGMFGFELIVLLGSVMTILVCLGVVRVGGALPLAITCLSGTILVSAIFGIHVDARNKISGNHPQILPWVNRTLYFDVAMIILLSLIATLDVYRRSARAWGQMLRAAVFLLPVIAILAWVQVRGAPATASASGEMNPLRMVMVLLVGLIVGILFSIGGHFLIRSFEVAIPDPGAEKSGKPAS